jgi:hypothetical protein
MMLHPLDEHAVLTPAGRAAILIAPPNRGEQIWRSGPFLLGHIRKDGHAYTWVPVDYVNDAVEK